MRSVKAHAVAKSLGGPALKFWKYVGSAAADTMPYVAVAGSEKDTSADVGDSAVGVPVINAPTGGWSRHTWPVLRLYRPVHVPVVGSHTICALLLTGTEPAAHDVTTVYVPDWPSVAPTSVFVYVSAGQPDVW